MLNNNVYDVLKWCFLIVCPALAVLIGVLGETWGLVNTQAWVTTINAIGVFGGAVIGVSSYHYNQDSDDSVNE